MTTYCELLVTNEKRDEFIMSVDRNRRSADNPIVLSLVECDVAEGGVEVALWLDMQDAQRLVNALTAAMDNNFRRGM